MKKFLVFLLGMVCLVSLAGNFLLFQRYSSNKPILRFGDETVTIKDYRDYLEYKFGGQVLRQITLQKLVMSEAKKAGVVPSDADIDQRIADIDRRTPSQLEQAKKDKTLMAELREGLRTDIALENLIIKDVKVSDAELHAFYDKNQKSFLLPNQTNSQSAVTDSASTAVTVVALMKQSGNNLAQIAKLPHVIVPGMTGNFNLNALPPQESKRVAAIAALTPIGQVATVKVPLPAGAIYIILKPVENNRAGYVPFNKAKPQIDRLVRLTKGMRRDVFMAKLFRDANVVFEQDYSRYFADLKQISEDRGGQPTSAPR